MDPDPVTTMPRLCLVPTFLTILLPAQDPAPPKPAPPVLGAGSYRYEWVPDWLQLDDGKSLGNTHGCLVVDRAGRVLANTDTEQAVVLLSADGAITGAWGKEYRGGLHGMTLRVEDGTEYLYLAHTSRHEVLKTTLDGKVLWTIGWPEAAGIYAKEAEFLPTAVAVAPDGRIFVADGYGKSWIHVYDAERSYVTSFGGPGAEAGKLRTPHGLAIDTRGDQPLLLVCDRENHRLQWFGFDGKPRRTLDRELRRPCNVWFLDGGAIAVADLAGRVSLFDRDDELIAHLGDNPDPKLRANNGVPRERWADGLFLAPHSVCADAQGDLYVMDWNASGRISKLRRVR
jgi:hypothetical protein